MRRNVVSLRETPPVGVSLSSTLTKSRFELLVSSLIQSKRVWIVMGGQHERDF